MAALTDTLANALSSRRVIDPGGGGPSWTEGLANLAKGLVGQGSQLYEQNQAEQRRTAAQTAAAQEASAANAASQLVFDQRLGRGEFAPVETPGPTPTAPDPYPNNAPIDASLEGAPPPPGVERIVNETTRARAAENQQRAPAGSTDIILERNLSRLLAQYPDQVNNIRKIFQDAGFDHYLFRESETEEALFQAERAGTIKMTQDYTNEAVQRGLVMPGTDLTTAAAVGQAAANQDYILKRQQDELTLRAGQTAEQRAQYNFNQDVQDREITQNFAAGMSSALQGPLSQLRNIFTQANGDQSALDLIPETLNALDTVANNWISAAIQGGAPPATVEAMRTQWAQQRPLIVDLVSGPGSELGVAEATLKSMSTNLGIDMMTALPTYSALKEIFGPTALADFATNMPQEMRDTIAGEIKGISGAIDTDGERVSVANIAQMLRGRLQITEMNESQARQAMPTIVGVARGQVRDMSSGRGNPQSYVNSSLQITNAAMELQPGAPRVDSEALVINTIYTPEARRVDLDLMRSDPQSGQLLINSKRAAARNILRNTATDRWMRDPASTANGVWSAHYNAAQGRWETRVTDAGYRAYVSQQNVLNASAGTADAERGYLRGGARGSAPVRPILSREELVRRGAPQPLTQRVGSVNLSLDYLVETNQFDEDFKGVSAMEARRLFLTGAVPAAMQQRVQAQTADGMSLAQQIEGYRTNLNQARTDSEQGYSAAAAERPVREEAINVTERHQTALNHFQGRGWSPAQAAGIVGNLMAESSSSLSTTIVGDGGQAIGLAQWHPDRRANARREGFDLTSLQGALDFVQWELENTESAAGRRLKAARTPQEAADIFALHFLRPAGAQTGDANQVGHIDRRRSNAAQLFRSYGAG